MDLKYKNEIPPEIYEYLLNNPFIGICITDGDGIVLAVNEAQSRITAVPKELFLGKTMQSLVDNKMLSISSTTEVLKAKKEIVLHQVVSNGCSYDVKGVPIFGEDGEIKYVVSYLLDISDFSAFQKMVAKLQEDREKLKDRYEALRDVLEHSQSIIYQSKEMQNVVELAKRVAESDASVLITGPSGSGKELIANILHEESQRKEKAFIKINCAVIPESLLESELFGYESGAFTGGNLKGKKGLFEYANGGSLLLDEIGEMPLSLQAKLLRVLQDQEVRRIGGSKTIKVTVRMIASTNASLRELINEKKFREDLYYRLNVIEIHMPSLDQRREDIPLLIAYFVRYFNAKYRKRKTISSEAIHYLSHRDYPGNVRELKNMVERLIVQSSKDKITLKDAYEAFGCLKIESRGIDINLDLETRKDASLKELVAKYEESIILEYLKIYGSMSAVAQKLKTDRTTIARKIKRGKSIK